MSLQSFLTRLIWLCVLPLLLLASYLATENVRGVQAARNLEAANLAKNFATVVDHELGARINGLHMLALSPAADDAARRKDLYREAQGFRESFGGHVILADLDMQMLFNTRVPYGTVLPKLPRAKGRTAAPTALQTGAPAVGDILFGPVARETLVAIAVPGRRDGKTAFLLLTTFETSRFQQRIDQMALPTGWSLSLLDGTGAAIARRTPPALNATTGVNDTGRFIVTSALSPWSVTVEIPRDIYRAPLVAAALALALLVLGATLVGILGGKLAGRPLARSIASLAQAPAPGARPPSIAEIAAVRRLLDDAETERATAEAALRASERRFRETLDNVQLIAVALDARGNVTYCNDFLLAMSGWRREELLDHDWFDNFVPDPAPARLVFEQAIRDGNLPLHYENEIKTRGGERRLIRWSNTILRDPAARIVGTVSLGEDITERRLLEQRNREQFEQLARGEAEGRRLLALAERSRGALLNALEDQIQATKALVESEERLRLTTAMADIAIWEYDFEADQMSRSENHDRLYGLAWQEKWQISTFTEATHPDDRERTNQIIQASVAPGGADNYAFDFRVVWPDGSLHWLWVKGGVIKRDPTGRGLLVRGVLLDITARRQAEAALRESEERFMSAFHTSPAAITITRIADGSFIDVNRAFLDLFEFGRDEVIGHTSTALGILTAEERAPLIQAQRESGGLQNAELATRTKSGRPVHVLFSSKPMSLAGEPHHVTTLIDITARKQADEEITRLNKELQEHAAELERRVAERTAQLEAAKIRAEAADRVKSSFLATMSHELRTPLNSIIGFTGILLQKLPGDLNAEQEKQLGMVRDASRHLLALINDVLDISKVEAGELHLARERFDLHALLERLGAAFAREAARRGLAFRPDVGKNTLPVTGDARRVEQVLNNLLSNALKFTPRGDIGLACRREGDTVVIGVTDTGVGIKPEDMDQLFRPFSQIETGLPGVREGTGLGLAISQHLAQAMGGRIAAESTWGRGSRFTFTLPAGGEP